MLEDGDLLDEVPTLDAHLLICQQVLDDHIRHVLAIGVAVAVQTVNGAEDQLVVGYGTILTSNGL